MARDRLASVTPFRKGKLKHCSLVEPEQHFEMRILGCCSFSLIARPWGSGIAATGRYFTSTMTVKMPALASDRGKIVENHRKQRDDALSLTSKAIAGPEYGKVRHIGSLTRTLFSTDPPLGLSWRGGFSELRNFPRFFHDSCHETQKITMFHSV